MEERLHREARVCAAVTHPNITTICGVNRHEGLWHFCIEFVEGETLRSMRGLVHRDANHDRPAGQVRGLDIGLAAFTDTLRQPIDIGMLETAADRLTSAGIALGTLLHVAGAGRPKVRAREHEGEALHQVGLIHAGRGETDQAGQCVLGLRDPAVSGSTARSMTIPEPG